MKLTFLLGLIWIVAALQGHAQYVGLVNMPLPGPAAVQSFRSDVEMKKVVVCREDQSVWAVSTAGKVYFKVFTETDFTEFSQTAGVVVADLAGYNANRMFFLEKPGTVYASNNQGPMRKIEVPGETFNDIAIVNGERNVYVSQYLQAAVDWLVIAGKNSMYTVLKSDLTNTAVPYSPLTGVTNWRITNSGFKSIDFQYEKNITATPCDGDLSHGFFNTNQGREERVLVPESGPNYSPLVNCTYFESAFNRDVDFTAVLDFWGTNDGLFVRKRSSCNTRKIITAKVNDLEELNFARNLYNIKVVLAASDDGLYYAQYSADASQIDAVVETMQFGRYFADLGKVNSIVSEVQTDSKVTEASYALCERVVWLATSNGIKRMALLPVRINGSTTTRSGSSPILSVTPDHGTGLNNLCNGNEYTINVNLPSLNPNEYTVAWFMDEELYANRRARPDFGGVSSYTTSERGEYGVDITLACGEVISTGHVWLRRVPDPIITFNPPDEIAICDAGSTKFTTDKNNDRGTDPYEFQWVKDDVVIDRATDNTYTATSAGVYRVQIKNCYGAWIPSKSVTVKISNAKLPVISRSSNRSLCFGETVTLSTPEVSGATYLWNNGATTREIVANRSGSYVVTVKTGTCGNTSLPAVVDMKAEITLDLPPQVQICTIKDERLRLTAQEGFAAYTWDGIRGTTPYLDVDAPGQYTLEVEDAGGCAATTRYVVVPYCPPNVAPNAFSPNGDGINDTWQAAGMEDDPDAVITIHNRFGETVFRASGKKPVWNGKYKGADLPPGIYYYVVIKRSIPKTVTGSIALIR